MEKIEELKETNLTTKNPCISCGACCASFRVAFYWRETEDNNEWNVPENLTLDLDPMLKCMKGTEQKHRPKCTALKGKIGERVECNIYSNRPSVCRNFKASYEKGNFNSRCDQARKAHGLPPLRRCDWESV